ncbi:fido domain-containing protein, partial [Rhexocercosporidium sp. MPI-PUGE-AT-0058]
VQRVEREIVQHVLGWRYLLRTFIHGKEELSEDMIKTTHSIVMHGISPAERSGETSSENGEGGTWEVHAGQYRSAEASSSSSSSSTHSPSPSPPSIIQRKMQELVTDFNTRISSSSLKESIDPVELAAEFSYRILRIQPFLYGNGRVARLFVNTILLHFLGVIAPFGQSSEERALYVGLMAKERLSQLKVG